MSKKNKEGKGNRRRYERHRGEKLEFPGLPVLQENPKHIYRTEHQEQQPAGPVVTIDLPPEHHIAFRRLADVSEAQKLLRKARDLLKSAGVSKSCIDRVRSALSSVGGAQRHALNRYNRQVTESSKK